MANRSTIYLDNAATTFPKPQAVLSRMIEEYGRLGVSPGRGSYDLSVEAGDLVSGVRKKLAALLGAPDPERVVFGANATDGLNLAIQGAVGPGAHVVSTRLEHNSVLRPLYHLKERGVIDYDLVRFGSDGRVDPDEFAQAIRPDTKLAIVSHASNVLGTVQPVREIAAACVERGVPLLVDVAQTAGLVPIDLAGWRLAAVAFTGHKALLGPSGIGGLAVAPDFTIEPTRFGGTGIESQSPVHTLSYPHRLEAGTLNLLGVIGLGAGLDYLDTLGRERLEREIALTRRLREGLLALPGIVVHSPAPADGDVPVLTCTVKGLATADVGTILDGDYDIAVRVGLHCAPLVHADLGTAPAGGVRFSLGWANTEADVDAAIAAMAEISGAPHGR